MKRRDFITLIGGAAVAWPFAARAQQRGQAKRIGALMPFAAEDRQAQARFAALLQGLQQSGWSVGRNIQLDSRWATTNAEIRKHAAELIASAPDVIFASGSVVHGDIVSDCWR